MFLFIKFVLIFGVFMTSTFIGYTLANRYRTRVAELNDLLLALEIFETKIKYTYDSLTTSFLYIADNLKTKAKWNRLLFQIPGRRYELFSNWTEIVESKLLNSNFNSINSKILEIRTFELFSIYTHPSIQKSFFPNWIFSLDLNSSFVLS
mgnify:CR=1 FL=1